MADLGRALVAGLLLVLLAPPLPAAADPPRPTNYLSQVTELEIDGPYRDRIEAEVIGGDAYLVLRVATGVSVLVPGYDGEPYLRFEEDGTVLVNERSPAHWLNDARYGAADVDPPPQAGPDAPPTWVEVASGGEYAWHDHRIHFMSPRLPRQVDPSSPDPQHVFDWTIPLQVAGSDAAIHGRLEWIRGPSVLWSLIAMVGAALVLSVHRIREGLEGVYVTVGALLGLALGATVSFGLPDGADRQPVLLALPAFSLVLVAAAKAVDHGMLRVLAPVPLLVFATLLSSAFSRPVVPGALPAGAFRAVVVLVLALGVASIVEAARPRPSS